MSARVPSGVGRLIRISLDVRDSDPLMAYELERSALSAAGFRRRAVVNPGVQAWEEHVENMVAVLQSLEKEIDSAIREAETLEDLRQIDEKVGEFAVLFGETAEEERLREYLDTTKLLGKTASTAGVKDFLKGVWDSVTKKGDSPDGADAGMFQSYDLDEDAMDAIVEGKADWMDASQYIEEEFKENKDFFSGVAEAIKKLQRVRKDAKVGDLYLPALQEIAEFIRGLIKKGKDMLAGVRQHLLEPVPQVVLEEDEEDEIPVEDEGSEVWDLEGTVEHYIDVLRDNLGDEKKLTSLLKELFRKVGPAVQEERGSIAARRQAQQVVLPILVRLAHARPHLRPAFLPIIRQATGH